MTQIVWLTVPAVLCLLAVSFLTKLAITGVTALTAAGRVRLLALAKAGNRKADLVVRHLDVRDRLLGALVIAGVMLNVGVTVLITGVADLLLGPVGMVYAIILSAVLIVVFAEVMPTAIGLKDPERALQVTARLAQALFVVLRPIAFLTNGGVRLILRLVGVRLGDAPLLASASEELRGAVDLLHKEGAVQKSDRDMLGGLLDLHSLSVADVMVHRTKMFLIDGDDEPAAIVKQVLAAPYTRIPIYRGTPDNIVGMLHAKDVLRALAAVANDPTRLDLDDVALPAWFVPDTTPLDEQLKSFRRRKSHFALVVDEYGVLMGLVTLEDIIEEIVGDISDEHDLVVTGVRPQADGVVNVDGSVPIRDLNRAMDWSLPDEEATTIAGLVIHEARTIPEPGQTFTFHGFRFQVLRKQRNRITSLRITPLEKPKPVLEADAGAAKRVRSRASP
jgi:Mg2+/Co2+ transporter CorB